MFNLTWGQIAACAAALAELDPPQTPNQPGAPATGNKVSRRAIKDPDFDPSKPDGGREYQDRIAELILSKSKDGKLDLLALMGNNERGT